MENPMTTQENLIATQTQAFELLQRQAKLLSQSSLLPDNFKNKISDCAIAIEMAQRLKNVAPLSVLQEIYIVHGKPSFSSKFIIALLKNYNGYKDFDYELTGEAGDLGEVDLNNRKIIREGRTCLAFAIDKNGNRKDGVRVSMAMSKLEGWYDKKGSKWQTIPELMLRYRAASMFKNLHCPEITMGIKASDEILDVGVQGLDPEFEVLDTPKKQTLFKKDTAVDSETSDEPTPAEAEAETPTKPAEENPKVSAVIELKELLKAEGIETTKCKNYCVKNRLLKEDEPMTDAVALRLIRGWTAIKTSLRNY